MTDRISYLNCSEIVLKSMRLVMFYLLVRCRARRSEARIQQMLWKINYSDIVFLNTVCRPQIESNFIYRKITYIAI